MKCLPEGPRVGRLGPLLGALYVLAIGCGCKPGGQLEIWLDLPSSGQGLNPMEDARLSHFSLILWGPDGTVEAVNNTPFRTDGGSLGVGQVPVGRMAGLTLVGYSSLNQVLAYGETGPFTVNESGIVPIDVALRKPFTYVAGGPQVLAFDNTRLDSDDTQSPLPTTGGTTTDIASTPDGLYLLVSVANLSATPGISPAIKLFSTAAHQPGREIPLVFKPGHISLSPDGRWAVVAEYRPDDVAPPPGTADQLAIVDVQAALTIPDPALAVRTLPLSHAGRVAFVRSRQGEDLAVVLRDALPPSVGCFDSTAQSFLSTLRLDTAQQVGEAVNLGAPVRDVASDPKDHRVFVADPCNHRVAQFDVDSQAVTAHPWSFQGVPPSGKSFAPYSVIVSGSRLWVGLMEEVPTSSLTPAQMIVASIEGWALPDTSTVQILSVPFPREAVRAETTGGSGGARVLVDMLPWRVRLFRLSVPPGEGRISALVRAEYYTDRITIQVTDGSSLYYPALAITSESYVSLDTGSAALRRRFRTSCFARDVESGSSYQCHDLAEHEMSPVSFSPRSVTSIYGVP